MRVKEVYKQCEWQDVFDVTLTAAIHHVFERDLSQSELSVNENEVQLTYKVTFMMHKNILK